MPFCKKCGKEVRETAKFCPYCSESMTKQVEPPKVEGQTEVYSEEIIPISKTSPLELVKVIDTKKEIVKVVTCNNFNRIITFFSDQVDCYDKEGSTIWHKEADFFAREIAITPSGSHAVIAVREPKLIDSRGNILWEYKWEHGASGIAAVAIDETGSRITMGSSEGYIAQFDATGRYYWEKKQEGWIVTLSGDTDGKKIVVGENNGKLSLIESGGTRWEYAAGPDVFINSVSFAREAGIIIVNLTSSILALDINGQFLWKKDFDEKICCVNIDTKGTLILIGAHKKIQICRPKNGEIIWAFEFDSYVMSIDSSADGRSIVVGTSNGKIYLYIHNFEKILKMMEEMYKITVPTEVTSGAYQSFLTEFKNLTDIPVETTLDFSSSTEFLHFPFPVIKLPFVQTNGRIKIPMNFVALSEGEHILSVKLITTLGVVERRFSVMAVEKKG